MPDEALGEKAEEFQIPRSVVSLATLMLGNCPGAEI